MAGCYIATHDRSEAKEELLLLCAKKKTKQKTEEEKAGGSVEMFPSLSFQVRNLSDLIEELVASAVPYNGGCGWLRLAEGIAF